MEEMFEFKLTDFDTEIKFVDKPSARILKLDEFVVPAGYDAMEFDIEISIKNSIGITKRHFLAEKTATQNTNVADLLHSRKENDVVMAIKITKPVKISDSKLDMLLRYRLE